MGKKVIFLYYGSNIKFQTVKATGLTPSIEQPINKIWHQTLIFIWATMCIIWLS